MRGIYRFAAAVVLCGHGNCYRRAAVTPVIARKPILTFALLDGNGHAARRAAGNDDLHILILSYRPRNGYFFEVGFLPRLIIPYIVVRIVKHKSYRIFTRYFARHRYCFRRGVHARFHSRRSRCRTVRVHRVRCQALVAARVIYAAVFERIGNFAL